MANKQQSFPEYAGIAISQGVLLACGLNREGLLSALSHVISTIDDGLLDVRRDVGSKFGDYFVIAYLIAGPPYAVRKLAEVVPQLAFSTEVLRGIELKFLPQIDYRESIEALHTADLSMKIHTRDRNGVQSDLLAVLRDRYDCIDHVGRVRSNGARGAEYHGSYTFRIKSATAAARDDADFSTAVDRHVQDLGHEIMKAFEGELILLVINGVLFKGAK